jgi:hypothetical protein
MSAGTPAQDTMVRQAPNWNGILSGLGRMGGNFLMGMAGGLGNYDPRNPYSSFAGAIAASTPNLQTMLAEPSARRRGQIRREEEELDALSKAGTAEQIAQGQASRASVISEGLSSVKMPDIAAAIKREQAPQREPYDFRVGMFPSIMQQEAPPSASGRVRNLMLGIQR